MDIGEKLTMQKASFNHAQGGVCVQGFMHVLVYLCLCP